MGSKGESHPLEITPPAYYDLQDDLQDVGGQEIGNGAVFNLATKSWQSLTWEVVTMAVGVGAFGLAEQVAVFGVLGFIVIFIGVGWTSFRISSWWRGQKAAWAKAKEQNKLGEYQKYDLTAYEDYGTFLCPGYGKAFLGFVQFLQISLICVVFCILLGRRMREVTRWGVTKVEGGGIKSQPAGDLSENLVEWGTLSVQPKDTDGYTKVISDSQKSGNVPWTTLKDATDMTIDAGKVGYISGEGAKMIWEAVPDITKLQVEEAWLRGEDGYYIPANEAKYSAEAKTVDADRMAKMFTIGLAITTAVLQPIGAINKLLGIVGIAGVVLSWLFIIYKMVLGFSDMQSAESVQIDWMPMDPVRKMLSQDGSVLDDLQDVVGNLSQFFLGALCCFGVSNIVPQLSKPVKHKSINKALAVGYITMFAVYLLPVGIYILKGHKADALDFISQKKEPKLKMAFELAICANMIASFALAGQGPAAQLRNLLKQTSTTKNKMLFRLIAALMQVGFAQLMPGGNFFNYLTLFMAFCVPVVAIIAPMIANWEIRKIVGNLYRDDPVLGGDSSGDLRRSGGRGASAGWSSWLETPILWTMFVLAVVCIPFGAWKSWKRIRAFWIVEGLTMTERSQVVFA